MNARTPVWLAASLALALAACVPDGETSANSGSSGPVGPGAAAADSLNTAMLFKMVCVDTAPSFRNAPAELGKLPFRQHPGTGTYYHQNVDISIKLMPHQCSMVFGSPEDAGKLGFALAAAVVSGSGSNSIAVDPDTGATRAKGPKATKFEFDPAGSFKGRNMYHAVLIAP